MLILMEVAPHSELKECLVSHVQMGMRMVMVVMMWRPRRPGDSHSAVSLAPAVPEFHQGYPYPVIQPKLSL